MTKEEMLKVRVGACIGMGETDTFVITHPVLWCKEYWEGKMHLEAYGWDNTIPGYAQYIFVEGPETQLLYNTKG